MKSWFSENVTSNNFCFTSIFSLVKTMVFFRNARDSRLLPFLLKRTIFITKFPWWVLVAKLRNLFHDKKAWVFKVLSKYISTFLVSLVKKIPPGLFKTFQPTSLIVEEEIVPFAFAFWSTSRHHFPFCWCVLP